MEISSPVVDESSPKNLKGRRGYKNRAAKYVLTLGLPRVFADLSP